MGIAEWALAALVAIAVIFVILRPDLWGKHDGGNSDGGHSVVGVHPDEDDDGEGH